jgi:spore germination cell wall hydrolase CwlJ-like protein
MNTTFRAGGFAAAALAFVAAATFADPSMATDAKAAPAGSYLDHADAPIETGPVVNATELAGIAQKVASVAYSAVPRPRSLDELVDVYQADEINEGEQACLAKAVYFEARSEPLKGQLAVADVILNRAESGKYPTGICEVITQKAQFSFIQKGKFPEPNKASKAWRKAVAVARIAHAQAAQAVPQDVLWYHADYVAPVWRHGLARNEKIGVHIFYGPKAKG